MTTARIDMTYAQPGFQVPMAALAWGAATLASLIQRGDCTPSSEAGQDDAPQIRLNNAADALFRKALRHAWLR